MGLTLPQLYDRIASLPEGGYLTVDSKLDPGYIYSLIHSARAFVIAGRWMKENNIPPIYYQRYEPDFRKLAQEDSCFIRFNNFPSIIQLDGRSTGMGYVGVINGQPATFREVDSRATMASYMTDRVMGIKRKPIVLVGNGFLEVYYRDKIKEFAIEAIFSDPTSVPSFNVDYDDYPIDMADISKIEAYITQVDYAVSSRTAVDRVSNSRDEAALPTPRK